MAKNPPAKQSGAQFIDERVFVDETIFAQKMADKSITVREALSYIADTAVAGARPKKSDRDRFNKTVNLIGQLSAEGVDVDAPYFDVYMTEEFNKALDPIESTAGINRWEAFGHFEGQLEINAKLIENPPPITRLSGAGGWARKKFKLSGVQSRGGDPMRGTIFSADLDAIYDEALNVESYEVFDSGAGTKKEVAMDPDARAYLYYEKYTGQRLESNIGPDGLKITDVTFGYDDDGNLLAEVAGKKNVNKVRPEVTYTGEFAEFLKAQHDKAMANLKAGEVAAETNLFRVSKTKVNSLWSERIQPLLEERFRDQLPEKKGGTHSVIRKILARQLLREFRVPRDAVKSWMGHAGVSVDEAGDILEENYTGAVPDERVGPISNILIHKHAKNMKAPTINELFIMNRLDIPRMTADADHPLYDGSRVVYTTPEKIDNLSAQGVANYVPKPTEQQLKTIDTLAKKQQVVTEIEIEELQKRLDDIKIANSKAKIDASPEAIAAVKERTRAKAKLRDAAAEENALYKAEKAAEAAKAELPPEGGTPALQKRLKEIGLATAGVVVSSAAKAATAVAKTAPVVSAAMIPMRVEELMDRYGMSREEAMAMAGVEEAVPPVGVGMAAAEMGADVMQAGVDKYIETGQEAFQEQYDTQAKITDESLDDVVARLITGDRMSGFMGR